MSSDIRRDIRLLKAYAVVVTLLLGTLSVAAFRQAAQKTKFTEIDVERINIVEPDGKLRLVISNTPRSIGPIYKGKPFGYPGGTRPGLIFFNDEGTENGGATPPPSPRARRARGPQTEEGGPPLRSAGGLRWCLVTARGRAPGPGPPPPPARRGGVPPAVLGA